MSVNAIKGVNNSMECNNKKLKWARFFFCFSWILLFLIHMCTSTIIIFNNVLCNCQYFTIQPQNTAQYWAFFSCTLFYFHFILKILNKKEGNTKVEGDKKMLILGLNYAECGNMEFAVCLSTYTSCFHKFIYCMYSL